MSTGSAFGHHGHETKIKLYPRSFQKDYSLYGCNPIADGDYLVIGSGGSFAIAQVEIPRGMKATHVSIHSANTGAYVEALGNEISDTSTATALLDSAGNTNAELTLDTQLSHSDTNYMTIRVAEACGNIGGGYVLIAPI